MIELLIFDIDGTLYKSVPEITNAITEHCISELAQKLNVSKSEAQKLFLQEKAKWKSSSRVLVEYGVGTVAEVMDAADREYILAKRRYLKQDPELLQILQQLNESCVLGTLRNGSLPTTHETLEVLGITDENTPFSHYFPTVELGVVKPDPLPFQNVLSISGLQASQVVMIGDRPEVDLVPAHALGMRTILVRWDNPEIQNPAIDFTVPTIYDVPKCISRLAQSNG
jgi:FMN phosphatase YigB (HAD superfamily)